MRLLVADTLKCLLIACCIAFGILGATHALAKSERQINPHDGYKWGKEDWNRGIRAHVREDYELAFKLFTEVAKLKATDLGEEDRHLIPYSEYILGLMYFHGQGVSKDYNKAHKLWTKLQGTFGPATFNVAVLMCKDWYGNHKNAWFFFKLAEQLGAPKGDCKSDLLNIFMESSSNPSFKPKPPETDEFICKGATKIDGNWESGSNYQQFVKEAEDRSLTLTRCSELTGRPNPNQISEQISEKDLCITATKPTGAWQKNYRYETYVQQAKDRNLTLERCSELTGRPNPEAAESKSAPSSSAPRSTSDLNKMADYLICFGATNIDGNWETNSVNEHYVREAKRRNFTLSKCSALTGRPNTQPSLPQSFSTAWEDISADEAEVKLKSFFFDSTRCRIRTKQSNDFSRQYTVFFCPSWALDGNPRTYIRVQKLFSNSNWTGDFQRDLKEFEIFTGKWKGEWFNHFKGPTFDPGQKTKCFNDTECSFQRVLFSVKSQECQYVFYYPDLTDHTSQSRSKAPYIVQIFTCHTSAPITKNHIEIKSNSVVITFPRSSHPPKEVSTNIFKPMSDKDLCMVATSSDGSWDKSYRYKKYFDMATDRNLSLERCSGLTRRPNPEASPPQSSSAKSAGKGLDNIEVRLKKLKKLEDAGLITSEEAAEKRKEILRDM